MAGFNFGAAAPTPAPGGGTPAPSTSGFSFGGGSGATPAPEPNAAPASGFSFGNNQVPAPAPATATGGISFGNTTGAGASATTTPAAAAAAGSTYSFAGTTATTTTTTTAAAPTSSSSHVMEIPSYESVFPYLSLYRRVQNACECMVDETKVASTPHAERLLQRHELRRLLLSSNASLVPKSSLLGSNNVGKKEQLLRSLSPSTLTVKLHGKETGMTPSILQDIITLADELHLEDSHAAALYAGASDVSTRAWLDQNLSTSFCQTILSHHKDSNNQQNQQKSSFLQPLSLSDSNDILNAARELYFYERSCCLSTILLLMKYRVHASILLSSSNHNNHTMGDHSAEDDQQQQHQHLLLSAQTIIEVTDTLLFKQNDLIQNLITFVREFTLKTEQVIAQITNEKIQKQNQNSAQMASSQQQPNNNTSFLSTATSYNNQNNTNTTTKDMDYVILAFVQQQRQMASECLFFITYNTQLTSSEVACLIDLIKDLTNDDKAGGIGYGLPQLDSLKDVPDTYEYSNATSTHNNANHHYHQTNNPFQQQQQQQIQNNPLVNKSKQQWQKELIANLWSIPGMKTVETITGPDYAGTWNAAKASNVPGGRPHLLQSVSILVLAAICALDTKNLFLDRDTHKFNTFGEGNALCKPNSSTISGAGSSLTKNFEEIHLRLDPNGERHILWKRQDIVGLLSAAYALFLKSTASTLSSPLVHSQQSPTNANAFSSPSFRGGGGNSMGGIDVKATFRSCLEIPTVSKSLTYVRFTLLPSLGCASLTNNASSSSGSNLDSDFAFFVSVLSTFTAQYLDVICTIGELPISRAQWLSDEEKELQVKHVQEEQKRQFGAWSGQAYTSQVPLPTEVDITQRPDCIDDVIALAVSICIACPDSAGQFWSTSNEVFNATDGCTQWKPMRVVKKLERLQAEDFSLLPAYLSFLAGIALADSPDDSPNSHNGAAVVHRLLSNIDDSISSPNSTNANTSVNWYFVIDSIRRYADVLGIRNNDNTSGLRTSSSSSSAGSMARRSPSTSEFRRSPSSAEEYVDSSSYYYGTESYKGFGSRETSTSGIEYVNGKANQSNANATQSSVTSRQTQQELGEHDTAILLSLLVLLSHVCMKSMEARLQILQMKIPVSNSPNFSSARVDDDALTILFSLLETNVSPDIRGLTFVAIANLVKFDNLMQLSDSNKEIVLFAGKRSWDLLDSSRILPISILSQYTNNQVGKFPAVNTEYRSSTFSFTKNQPSNGEDLTEQSCWFLPSKSNGLLYEMEYVESQSGVYPSTEGVLYLLTALISTVGCPSDIGFKTRPRPGCSPYVEFVIDFVLQRIMGTRREDKGLSFATPADRCRLLTRVLEVIDSILVRYIIPTQLNSDQANHNRGNDEFSGITNNFHQSKSTKDVAIANILSDHESSVPAIHEQNGLSLVKSFLYFSADEISLSREDIIEYYMDYSNEMIDMSTEQQTNNEYGIKMDNGMSYFDSTQRDMSRSIPMVPSQSNSVQPLGQNVPRPKSPGFYVLSDVLSTDANSLFRILSQILVENEDARGIHTVYGESIYSKSLAMALYGDSIPMFEIAKKGRDYILHQQKLGVNRLRMPSMPSSFIQSSMQSLYTPRVFGFSEKTFQGGKLHLASKDDAIFWRERNILLALRILCASAGREDSFIQAMKSSSSYSMVPVLRFKSSGRGSSFNMGLEVKNVQVSRISNLIKGTIEPSTLMGRCKDLAPVLAQYVGYQAISLHSDQDIAIFAMSLISYITKQLSQQEYVHALCGKNMSEQRFVAKSIATRLALPSKDNDTSNSNGVKLVILDLLLLNLSQGTYGDENLSHILLGLSGKELNDTKHIFLKAGTRKDSFELGLNKGCLDAVLELIADLNFVIDPRTSTLASKCYELIYRLCTLSGRGREPGQTAILIRLCVMERLRAQDFWFNHLRRFFSGAPETSQSLFQRIIASSTLNEENNYEKPLSLRRDHDLLHCISWLFSGLSIELHSLMGLDASQTLCRDHNPYVMVPKPTQCRRLLGLLFGNHNEFMTKALVELPLSIPLVVKKLNADAPPREFIRSVSKIMEGPADVCGSYEVIDLKLLSSKNRGSYIFLSNFSRTQETSALKWAKTWNSYVSYVCTASHLASSWNEVLQTSTLCCKPLLFNPFFNGSTSDVILNKSGIIDILRKILTRLNKNNDMCLIDSTEGRSCDLEASVVLPLGVSVLHLIGLISDISEHNLEEKKFSASSENQSHKGGFYFDDEDLVEIAQLIAGAIEVCSYGGSSIKAYPDERAASLSLALSMILSESSLLSGRLPLPSNLADSFREFGISAGRHLSRLSCLSLCEDDLGDSLEGTSICLAARSGFSSLLTYFEKQNQGDNDSNNENSFLSQILTDQIHHRKNTSSLGKLVQLLSNFDTDVTSILENIASCEHGTELIYQAGATKAMLSSAKQYLHNIASNSNGHLEVEIEKYGSVVIDPPNFLFGHLSLLNIMLSSNCNVSTMQGIFIDVAHFLQLYFPLLERLIISYPRDNHFLLQFMTCLYLTSSGLNCSKRNSFDSNLWMPFGQKGSEGKSIDFVNVFGKDLSKRLEQRVLNLVYHLSEFPFPSHLLPTLPPQLRSIRRSRLSKLKHFNARLNDGRSWWDLILPNAENNQSTSLSLKQGVLLPDPPTGSSDITSLDRFSRKIARPEMNGNCWSEQDYDHASSSALCLEVCIMFLCSQLSVYHSNLHADILSLSIGLCRCADVSRAIDDRLNSFQHLEENDISGLFGLTSLNDAIGTKNNLSLQIKNIERNILASIGPIFGRCTENLLYFIYNYTLRRLGGNPQDDKFELTASIMPALEHTQVETMGIGCLESTENSKQENKQFCVAIAKKLREQLK